MFLWVIIAFIGLLIYMNPSLLVRHTYEGFNVEKPTTQQPPTSANQQAEKPLDVNSMLRNLEQLLNTPGSIPDVKPTIQVSQPQTNTYTASVGGRQQPAESEQNKASTPQSTNQPPVPSMALAQGKAFQTTKPQATETAATPAVKEIIKERIVEVPVPRTCPPPQAPCPVCPDMQNYIRKDSIPCWACKL